MTELAVAPASARPAAAYRFDVGHHALRVLDDGAFVVTGEFLAANAPPRALAEALAASGRSPTGFSLPIHPLLIETHGRLVLADTGFGVGYRATRPDAGKLLEALRAERIAPGEIDVVLFTHLHPDHALGALDADGKPAFANAWHLVNRVEYEFWWADPSLDELPLPDERRRFIRQAAKQVLVALQGRIDQVEPEAESCAGDHHRGGARTHPRARGGRGGLWRRASAAHRGRRGRPGPPPPAPRLAARPRLLAASGANDPAPPPGLGRDRRIAGAGFSLRLSRPGSGQQGRERLAVATGKPAEWPGTSGGLGGPAVIPTVKEAREPRARPAANV